MGDSPLLEIALGLLFLFTLFSVLVSAANEVIVGFFKSRSASLWEGILTLFNNDENLHTKFFEHPLIKSLEPPKSIGWMLNNTKSAQAGREPSRIGTQSGGAEVESKSLI